MTTKCPTCREPFTPTRQQRWAMTKGAAAYCSPECRPHLPHGGARFEWTDELRETVVLDWLAGMSATEIAKKHSTPDHDLTRSAIMGVIHRSGARRTSLGPRRRVA